MSKLNPLAATLAGILIVLLFYSGHSQEVNLLTYNIRYDNPADGPNAWPLRKAELGAYVFDGSHAIIGLQEVLHHQLSYLDSCANEYAYFGVGRDDGQTRGEYSPVFWKESEFQFLEGTTRWLSETPHQPSKGWDAACVRIATMVKLKEVDTQATWCIINTHWDHEGADARVYSAELIAEIAQEAKETCDAVVVMGDFNALHDDPAFQAFEGVLKVTAPRLSRRRSTFNAFNIRPRWMKHIDDFYVDGGLAVKGYRIEEPKTKTHHQLSDHFPVQVLVELN
jgi:endonuclease/exonuclease/phosphatase family metal-dependent hydrolase